MIMTSPSAAKTPSDSPPFDAGSAPIRKVLQSAIQAPSSHNTQPWRFAVEGSDVHLYADRSRWLRVADADQRELFVSVGCALENVLVAAEHAGFGTAVQHDVATAWTDGLRRVATVTLRPSGTPETVREGLFAAIPKRHTNHNTYNDRPLSAGDRQALQQCVVETDVELWMTGDAEIRRRVDDLVTRADALQFADPAWRKELGDWMGRGVFGTSWLMSKVGKLAVTYLDMGDSQAQKDRDLLGSAPVLAVLATDTDDRAAQVRAGQALERVWLAATQRGLALHPMNQILQLPDLKEQVQALLPRPAMHPQITFRLGHAEAAPSDTPRRPVSEVLLDHVPSAD
jgi:nitroreductase